MPGTSKYSVTATPACSGWQEADSRTNDKEHQLRMRAQDVQRWVWEHDVRTR